MPIALAIFLLLSTFAVQSSYAQDSDNQLILVHHEKVKPKDYKAYMEVSKKFVQDFKSHAVSDVSWWAGYQNDYNFVWVVPIDNMAQLDKSMWTEAKRKMGEDKFKALMAESSPYIVETKEEIYELQSDLGYTHQSRKGLKDKHYRKWTTMKFGAETTHSTISALAKEWKELYAKHNVEFEYRVYLPVIGPNGNTVVLMDMAKNAADLAAMEAKANETLGEEGDKLWAKTVALIDEIEVKTGSMLPELFYFPKPVEGTAGKE